LKQGLKIQQYYYSLTFGNFDKLFYEKPDAEFEKSLKIFKAAVDTARAGSDLAFKQVSLTFEV